MSNNKNDFGRIANEISRSFKIDNPLAIEAAKKEVQAMTRKTLQQFLYFVIADKYESRCSKILDMMEDKNIEEPDEEIDERLKNEIALAMHYYSLTLDGPNFILRWLAKWSGKELVREYIEK
ncbi:hypothetical protein MK079_04190 [Candidatus Gracilibacteria bacterium]|nr:hypothetical protein [Candidatus Gracilibacteria bacterium]